MGKQTFRHVRFYAKWVGLVFVLAAVLLFVLQFVPTYTGKGLVFWIFIMGGFAWGLDNLWSTLHDIKEIAVEINRNRPAKLTQPKRN